MYYDVYVIELSNNGKTTITIDNCKLLMIYNTIMISTFVHT